MTTETINDRYDVVRELGRGGMGVVYLARDRHQGGDLLALKTLLAERASKSYVDGFREEFSELSKLQHPNISKAYDFGTISGTKDHFFTTEFVEGVDLYRGTEGASIDQLLDLTAQFLRGLDFLHSHGLLHNDLKPANALLAKIPDGEIEEGDGNIARLEAQVYGVAGCLKLIDFGLLTAENTAWSNIRGTARYLSPERIRCQAADRRSDLYSLGCILYLLVSRRHAFQAKDSRALLQKHLSDHAAPVSQHRADLPAPLVHLVHRLIEKNPDDRFESARAALSYLGERLGWEKSRFEVGSRTPELVAGTLLFRDQEITELSASFQAAAEGDLGSRCVALTGPDGAGKSRLAEDLRSQVQVAGGVFIDVSGALARGHLQSLLDCVLADFRRRGVSGLERREAAIRTSIKEDAGTDLACSLERLIATCASRVPVLIYFDDLHRASPTIRHFAVELAHSVLVERTDSKERSKLLVLLSMDNSVEESGLSLDGVHTLPITAFNDEQSEEFLHRVYGQEDIPSTVVASLTRIAQGNPGLLLELARTLVAEKIASYNGSRWDFPKSIDGIPLPGNLADSMIDRLNLIGSKARAIIEWQSLSSTPLSAEFLGRCAHLAEGDVELVLKRLVKHGLATCDASEEPARYDISNQALKERIAAKLNEERRKFVHQRLAQNLEVDAVGSEPEEGWRSELLAHHWLATGNLPAFLRYAPRAAERLQRSGNVELALEYHRRLVDQIPQEAVAKRIKSLVRLTELHEFLWDLDRSKTYLREVLKLGKGLLKPADRVALLRRLASLEISQRNYGAANKILAEARSATEDPLGLLSLDAPEAWTRFLSGDTDAAVALQNRAERALKAISQDGSEPRTQAILIASGNHLANLLQFQGKLSGAIEVHETNLERLEAMAMPQAQAATHASLAGVLIEAGRQETAVEHLKQACDIGKEIGDRRTLCRAREHLGLYNFLYGDLRSALHITQMGLEDARSIQNLPAMANNLRLLARIYRRAGQQADAKPVLERALALYRDTGDVLGSALSHLYLARQLIAEGCAPQAETHLEAASEEASSHPSPLLRGLERLVRAELCWTTEQVLDAGLVEEAAQILRHGEYRREFCDVEILRARAALHGGHGEPAEQAEQAENILAELHPLLEECGSKEQNAERNFLKALATAKKGSHDEALARLNELKSWARSNVFPALVQSCDETSRALSLQSQPT